MQKINEAQFKTEILEFNNVKENIVQHASLKAIKVTLEYFKEFLESQQGNEPDIIIEGTIGVKWETSAKGEVAFVQTGIEGGVHFSNGLSLQIKPNTVVKDIENIGNTLTSINNKLSSLDPLKFEEAKEEDRIQGNVNDLFSFNLHRIGKSLSGMWNVGWGLITGNKAVQKDFAHAMEVHKKAINCKGRVPDLKIITDGLKRKFESEFLAGFRRGKLMRDIMAKLNISPSLRYKFNYGGFIDFLGGIDANIKLIGVEIGVKVGITYDFSIDTRVF